MPDPSAAPDRSRPLAGLTVVDAATFLSGPLAGQALADLGAEVVKVEPPGGDAMRRFGRTVEGLSVLWLAANRTKRLIEVDLSGKAGRRQLDEVLAGADVLITNWRPGVAERLGLHPERVRTTWPRLVWCRISGFGQGGPRALEPAYDSVIQAAAGVMATQGAGGPPELVRGFLADKITATYATQAITAALFHRSSTGEGTVVDVAMLDALAYFDFPDVLAARALPSDDGTDDGVNQQLASVRAVPTADGWMVLSPVRARQLRAAMEVAGHPEWGEELRQAGDSAAVTVRFYELFSRVSPTRSTAAWMADLGAVDVPAAEVLDADGHLRDPQVLHNGTYETERRPLVGEHRHARYPARWPGRSPS